LRGTKKNRLPVRRAGSVFDESTELELHHFVRRRTLLALNDFELDLVTLGQGLEALSLDRGMMNEDVLGAIFRGDETKSLVVVEPLHGSSDSHIHHFLQSVPEFARSVTAGTLFVIKTLTTGSIRSTQTFAGVARDPGNKKGPAIDANPLEVA